jgi:hypothetical protein
LHEESENHIEKSEKLNGKELSVDFLEEGFFADFDTCLVFCSFLQENFVRSKK